MKQKDTLEIPDSWFRWKWPYVWKVFFILEKHHWTMVMGGRVEVSGWWNIGISPDSKVSWVVKSMKGRSIKDKDTTWDVVCIKPYQQFWDRLPPVQRFCLAMAQASSPIKVMVLLSAPMRGWYWLQYVELLGLIIIIGSEVQEQSWISCSTVGYFFLQKGLVSHRSCCVLTWPKNDFFPLTYGHTGSFRELG